MKKLSITDFLKRIPQNKITLRILMVCFFIASIPIAGSFIMGRIFFRLTQSGSIQSIEEKLFFAKRIMLISETTLIVVSLIVLLYLTVKKIPSSSLPFPEEKNAGTYSGDGVGAPDNDQSIKSIVEQYVYDNYADINLSLYQIASYLNMHYVHVSATFKEQSGIGIQDFIQRVRIKKACALLAETNKKLTEVARMVGYLNMQTFVRNFKKNMGVSPNQYRIKSKKSSSS